MSAAAAQPFPLRIPFVEWLGVELLRFDGGEAELRLEPRPQLCNSWQVLHGGVTMTLLDVAMAHAARSPDRTRADSPGIVTIEMKTQFVRAVDPQLGAIVASGRLLERSASLAFTEGRLTDGHGRLCALASGTFKFLRALPAGAADTRALQRGAQQPEPPPGSD
jgi:uncharacterized protein (TIGR00369 family)